MSAAFRRICEEALALPEEERERLADLLRATVAPVDQESVDAQWLEECERRWQLYKDGKMKTAPADAALVEIRKRVFG